MNEPEPDLDSRPTLITVPEPLFLSLRHLLNLSVRVSECFEEFAADTGPKNAFALAEAMRHLNNQARECDRLWDDYKRSEAVLDESGAVVAFLKRETR